MSKSTWSEFQLPAGQVDFDCADAVGVGLAAAHDPINLMIEAELRKPHIACINFYCFVHFYRRKQGLTVSELAFRAKVDFNELIALENDTQFKLRIDSVFGIAEFFDVDKDALIKMSRLNEPYFDPMWDEKPVQFPHNVGSLRELNPFEKASLEWLTSFLAKQAREKRTDIAA